MQPGKCLGGWFGHGPESEGVGGKRGAYSAAVVAGQAQGVKTKMKT
jgi:hypothetical protein